VSSIVAFIVTLLSISVSQVGGSGEPPNPPPIIAQAATPLEVQIITSTPPPVDLSTPTIPFTPSPEVQSGAMLQAKQSAGEINVRADANIDADPLGTIAYGEQYIVTGRYFRWLQFRFEEAPQGYAWVFDELVEVTGNESLIPDLSQLPQPTTDATVAFATENAAAILLTPGGDLTTTASSREILDPVAAVNSEGVTIPQDSQANPESQRTILPTFTYPPSIGMIATEIPNATDQIPPTQLPPSDVVPPIVPIILLGGFGMLGLTISALRR
jgi:hypothetical protein